VTSNTRADPTGFDGAVLPGDRNEREKGFRQAYVAERARLAFCFGPIVLLLSVLIFLANAAIAQNPSPAFWELRPERVDAMLLPVPKDNDRRYARLRGFFTDLHCTRALMQEQAIHERSAPKPF
jgi:hypothetical protein